MPTYAQFLDLIQHASGEVVAAVGLFIILVTGQRHLWRWGGDYDALASENKALKAENEQLRTERDEARFLAITGAGMAERLRDRAKGLR